MPNEPTLWDAAEECDSGQPERSAPTSKLTLQQLESHLWGAADILRGKIDSGGYKPQEADELMAILTSIVKKEKGKAMMNVSFSFHISYFIFPDPEAAA